MAKSKKVFDVFISHSLEDKALVDQIASHCRASGLEIFVPAESITGDDFGDAIWDALYESRALILVLSSAGLTPMMTVELGGAWGTNKPVFGIVTNPLMGYSDPMMNKIMLYPKERIFDVIQAIQKKIREFSERDREILVELYSLTAATIDHLIDNPDEAEPLTEAFAKKAGRRVDGDHLLSELLRLRKQGKLPRRRPARHSAS